MDKKKLKKLKLLSATAHLDNLYEICDIGDAFLDLPRCGNNPYHGKKGKCSQCHGLTYRDGFYRLLLTELKSETLRRGGTKDISPYTNMGFHIIANLLSLIDVQLKLLNQRVERLEKKGLL